MAVDNQYYALITGASAGIGRALSEELARCGHNIVAVALPDTGLREFCTELSEKYRVDACCLETDLSESNAPELIREYTLTNKLQINILVNNVGIGFGGEAGQYSTLSVDKTIFLNMRCTTLMINTFLDDLKRAPSAFILNIGSLVGFMPMPFKSLYAASKAYIYYLSLGIREELSNTSVSVSVVMPGPVKTNSKVRDRIRTMGIGSRITTVESDTLAREAVKQMFGMRAVIIPGCINKAIFVLATILPYMLLRRFLKKTFKGVN